MTGLDAQEVLERRAQFGPNDIESRETRGLTQTLRSVAAEPMFVLLLAAAALYLVIGDLGEGMLLAFFACVSVGLVIYQERRSERALDALRNLAAPQARVVRAGLIQRIAARDLVPGDWIHIAEGERIPADAVLREAYTITVDESLLTGESVPVSKTSRGSPTASQEAAAACDGRALVYASTLMVSGRGVAEVLKTGASTRVGTIGSSLAAIAMAPTPLEQHLRRLVRAFGVAALALCAFLVLWYGWRSNQWIQGALSGIALAMAMMPEEFPMVFAVFLALGAWRLARIQVLARRPAVIEALGAATMLCVDKTGTLTENRMRLRSLVTAEEDIDITVAETLADTPRNLLHFACLASRPQSADPMEQAILAQGQRILREQASAEDEFRLEAEYPLEPDLLAMTQVWLAPDGRRRIAAKGAPEAIADLCHLSAAETDELMQRSHAVANEGCRVIAVAQGALPSEGIPTDQREFNFSLLGLLALEDPLRAGVPAAIAQAHAAGIGVAMMTGDHASTALAIARQAGLDTSAGALSGKEIDRLSDAGLGHAVRRVRVFARVTPEQKLRLVGALREIGAIVAMTGDGVNDAPALKAAHIGIAMGARGTDVAREAAGLVLLDDDFGRLVAAVRMGRRIFDNLRRVMVYITAVHIPVAGLALLPVLFGLPPLLLPVHVVLTEMVIDPACSLAFEGVPEDRNVMTRPPRRSDDVLVGWPMLWRGLLQGGGLLVATAVIFSLVLRHSGSEDIARTCTMVGLTLGNVLLVGANASAGKGWRALFNRAYGAFWAVALLAVAALTGAVAWAPARHLLHFGTPEVQELLWSVLLVILTMAIVQPLTNWHGARPQASR